MWGKVAYFDFGQGTANPFPGYDDGSAVYPELLNMLSEAVTNLAKEAGETAGNDDLIYAGNLQKWTKLANSLRLKLYNNVRKTPLYDAGAVAAIIDNASVLENVSDGFRLLYGTSNNPENRHPLFVQDYGRITKLIDPFLSDYER